MTYKARICPKEKNYNLQKKDNSRITGNWRLPDPDVFYQRALEIKEQEENDFRRGIFPTADPSE